MRSRSYFLLQRRLPNFCDISYRISFFTGQKKKESRRFFLTKYPMQAYTHFSDQGKLSKQTFSFMLVAYKDKALGCKCCKHKFNDLIAALQ
jgi:hypothetical protein